MGTLIAAMITGIVAANAAVMIYADWLSRQ